MTVPSIPEPLEELAAGYVLGELDTKEASQFRQLLAENPELLQEVNYLQQLQGQLLYALTEVEPPQHLRLAILEAANIPANSTPIAKRSFLPWSKIFVSVAALLVLVLGLDNYRLRQDLTIAKNVTILLQQPENRLFSLRGMNTAISASGSFVMNLGQQKGVIVIRNLPPPPAGHVYRLWAVVEGEKIPCGKLSANPQGVVLEQFSMPADLYDSEVSQLIVTLETSLINRYPQGPVVLKSIVTRS